MDDALRDKINQVKKKPSPFEHLTSMINEVDALDNLIQENHGLWSHEDCDQYRELVNEAFSVAALSLDASLLVPANQIRVQVKRDSASLGRDISKVVSFLRDLFGSNTRNAPLGHREEDIRNLHRQLTAYENVFQSQTSRRQTAPGLSQDSRTQQNDDSQNQENNYEADRRYFDGMQDAELVRIDMNIVEGSYNVYDANGQLHQEQGPPPKGKINSSFMPNVKGVRWTDSVFTAVGGNYTGPRALSGSTLSRQTQSGLSVQHSASYPGPNAYQPNGQQTGSTVAMPPQPKPHNNYGGLYEGDGERNASQATLPLYEPNASGGPPNQGPPAPQYPMQGPNGHPGMQGGYNPYYQTGFPAQYSPPMQVPYNQQYPMGPPMPYYPQLAPFQGYAYPMAPPPGQQPQPQSQPQPQQQPQSQPQPHPKQRFEEQTTNDTTGRMTANFANLSLGVSASVHHQASSSRTSLNDAGPSASSSSAPPAQSAQTPAQPDPANGGATNGGKGKEKAKLNWNFHFKKGRAERDDD
ncbi:hypothetical protein CVT26_006351 [Gymnopilus dilepis]|uniref:Uncharacterized protein n=1 Tax=Gymnopilus dilepis TaxID=231916 RepID=A0A409W672_9AGAR|nr:hypothetical protein CVT26_006351 [Gymnopilus dilepis]